MAASLHLITSYLLNYSVFGHLGQGRSFGTWISEIVYKSVCIGSWHLCQAESVLELVPGQAKGQAFPGLRCKSCDVSSFIFLSFILARGRDFGSALSDFLTSLVPGCRQKGSLNKAIYSPLPAFRWISPDEVAASSKVVKQFCLTWLF